MNYIQLAAVIVMSFTGIILCQSITPAEQCTNENFDNLRERVQVIPCGSKQCKLRKETNVTVVFKFRPKFEVKRLTNKVYATIGVLTLPFVGVNGVDACPQVTRVADGQPAPCPLAADEEYTYTNVFFIERVYPITSLRVHWSLNDDEREVICFEVPAKITAAKKH